MTNGTKTNTCSMPIVDTLTIFDRVVTPIWIYDVENYRVSWANDAAVKLWSAPDKYQAVVSLV